MSLEFEPRTYCGNCGSAHYRARLWSHVASRESCSSARRATQRQRAVRALSENMRGWKQCSQGTSRRRLRKCKLGQCLEEWARWQVNDQFAKSAQCGGCEDLAWSLSGLHLRRWVARTVKINGRSPTCPRDRCSSGDARLTRG